MSLNLLRTAPSGNGRFRKKYIHNDASSDTDTMFFSCEYNRIVYTLIQRTIASNVYYIIQSVGISSLETKYIGSLPRTMFDSGNTNHTIGGFLCDGEYIYISFNSSSYIFKVNISTMTLLTAERFPNDLSFAVWSEMQWYDDHTIALLDANGLALFDTKTNEFTHIRYKTSGTTSRIGFAFSDKCIADTNTNFAYYNRETDTFKTISFPVSNYRALVCYGDGKFYVVNQAYVFIFDEETEAWEENYIPIPFGTYPKYIAYADGLVYIFINQSNKCWVFDTESRKYSYMFLPWKFNKDNNDSLRFTVTTFRKYVLFQNYNFAIINFNGLYKYRVGYKIIQYRIMCNRDTEYFEKDPCIELTQGYLTLKNVPEIKPFQTKESTIKTVSISKKDYKTIYDIRII